MMKYVAIAVALCAAVVTAQGPAPRRPVLPEDFQAEFETDFRQHNESVHQGFGRMAADTTASKGVEQIFLHDEHSHGRRDLMIEHLLRFDQGRAYHIDETREYAHCTEEKVTGKMPLYWGWLATAVCSSPLLTPSSPFLLSSTPTLLNLPCFPPSSACPPALCLVWNGLSFHVSRHARDTLWVGLHALPLFHHALSD